MSPLLSEVPVISPVFQGILNGLGWLLAEIYDLIPNFGVTIIVLTIIIRLVLLPLGMKQIRSMQNMQVIQPKVKGIQQKYKGNRQKQQEETMKLYKEHGVNPLSGCWPVLLQFPILIAMYSVVRFPQHPPHLPEASELRTRIERQIFEGEQVGGTDFLSANLLCSALQAGNEAKFTDPQDKSQTITLDCGKGIPARIPYYAFAVLMFATTYYQQRQMQKASPPGAQSQQQQILLKVMPLMFGVFGFTFPAGLVVYWTTSNFWQIGQQAFMLRRRPSAESLATATANGPKKKAPRKGFMAGMMDRADKERARREGASGKKPVSKNPKAGGSKPGSKKQIPGTKKPGAGGTNATRNRKKRPKR